MTDQCLKLSVCSSVGSGAILIFCDRVVVHVFSMAS